MEQDYVDKQIDAKIIEINNNENIYEIGTVVNVKDFIIEVSGINNVIFYEKINIANKAIGYVNSINENSVTVAVLKIDSPINVGDMVYSTNTLYTGSYSKESMGRVIDLFGNDKLSNKKYSDLIDIPIERKTIPIMDRGTVNRPLYTGITGIDLMYPIGKGQRQLIIGDKRTGKTQIGLDAIVNQRNKNVLCFYVAIGKTKKEVKNIYSELTKKGALDYTTIITAFNDELPPVISLVPYFALSIAQNYMMDGYDVLVVIDDLKRHAEAYREISLISGKTPGRDAYPADIFYTHSRLLEKGCQHKNGGSITILPIVETKGGDITDYISTNIISITDGQIVLSEKSFQKGEKPAIDYGLSVSRLGGAVQEKNMKAVGSAVRRKLLSYLETRSVYELVNMDEMSFELKNQFMEGKIILDNMMQYKFSPKSPEEMMDLFMGFVETDDDSSSSTDSSNSGGDNQNNVPPASGGSTDGFDPNNLNKMPEEIPPVAVNQMPEEIPPVAVNQMPEEIPPVAVNQMPEEIPPVAENEIPAQVENSEIAVNDEPRLEVMTVTDSDTPRIVDEVNIPEEPPELVATEAVSSDSNVPMMVDTVPVDSNAEVAELPVMEEPTIVSQELTIVDNNLVGDENLNVQDVPTMEITDTFNNQVMDGSNEVVPPVEEVSIENPQDMSVTPEVPAVEGVSDMVPPVEEGTIENPQDMSVTPEVPVVEGVSDTVPAVEEGAIENPQDMSVTPEVPAVEGMTDAVSPVEEVSIENPQDMSVTPEVPAVEGMTDAVPPVEEGAIENPQDMSVTPEVPAVEGVSDTVPSVEEGAIENPQDMSVAPEVPVVEGVSDMVPPVEEVTVENPQDMSVAPEVPAVEEANDTVPPVEEVSIENPQVGVTPEVPTAEYSEEFTPSGSQPNLNTPIVQSPIQFSEVVVDTIQPDSNNNSIGGDVM